jgi:hypothetical protein
LLRVTNGPIPNFQYVLESLVVKVTMFDRSGRPVRATASVTFKELRLKGGDLERPNRARGGRSGARPGQNWQAPTEAELAEAGHRDDFELE